MRRRAVYFALLLGLIASGLSVRIADPAPIARLRLLVFDVYQWISPRTYDPALPVRIVDIDDASIKAIGQWPWPRTVLAQLTERLTELGASAIAFDIVMAEPDRSAPSESMKRLPIAMLGEPLVKSFVQRLAEMPNPDDAFARAIDAGPVVMGFIGSNEAEQGKINKRAGFATAGDEPKQFVARFSGSVASLDAFQAGAKGAGSLNWVPDYDQIIRRLPLLVRVGDELQPSLAAEALRVGQGAGSYVVKASGASGEEAFGRKTGIVSVRIGALEVPTDHAAELWLRFTHTDRRRFVSAERLLKGEVDRSQIEGRIILVGTSAAGLFDLRATPLDSAVAGVEVHAQAIEQILSDLHLRRPDFADGLELVFLVVAGLAMGVLVYATGAAASAAFGATLVVAALVSSWFAFQNAGWLLDPVYPLITLTGIYLVTTGFLYWRTEGERNRVRDAFKQYLAPSLVEELAKHPEKLKLGGELRRVTLMFCDVRGFTGISEQLDAQQLTQFLNRLLTPLTEAILTHRGTVDKYMGDAIMAFWNAPLDDDEHEANSARAALAMVGSLDTLNQQWAAEAASRGTSHTPVRLGIGLNTAECCVGNLGSQMRFDYSVIGDGVNVASRLEGRSKYYGLQIVLGEATAVKSRELALIEIDLVRVVGRQEVSRLYTLLGPASFANSPEFVALKTCQDAILVAFRNRQFEQASALLEQARGMPAARPLARLYDIYADRIGAFKLTPPAQSWTGAVDAEEK